MKPIGALPVLLLLLSPAATANPAPVGGPGETPVPYKPLPTEAIGFVEEKVEITDGLVGGIPSFAPGGGKIPINEVEFDGTYWLANLTEKRTKVKIGFPMLSGGMQAGGSYGGISDFKVTVRGKALPVSEITESEQHLFEKDLTSLVDDPRLEPAELAALLKAGFAREMEFNPELVDLGGLGKSKAEIEKHLDALPGLDPKRKESLKPMLEEWVLQGWDFRLNVSAEWRVFEVTFEPKEKVEIGISYRSSTGYPGIPYTFSYVLTTGRYWKGPIGRCRVILHLAPGLKAEDYRLSPAGFERSDDGTLRFEKAQLLPTENIVVRVREE